MAVVAASAHAGGTASPSTSNEWAPLDALRPPRSRTRSRGRIPSAAALAQSHAQPNGDVPPLPTSAEAYAHALPSASGTGVGSDQAAPGPAREHAPPRAEQSTSSNQLQSQSQSQTQPQPPSERMPRTPPTQRDPDSEFYDTSADLSTTPLGRRRLKSQAAMMTSEERSAFGPLGGPAPDVSDRYVDWESRPRKVSRPAEVTLPSHSAPQAQAQSQHQRREPESAPASQRATPSPQRELSQAYDRRPTRGRTNGAAAFPSSSTPSKPGSLSRPNDSTPAHSTPPQGLQATPNGKSPTPEWGQAQEPEDMEGDTSVSQILASQAAAKRKRLAQAARMNLDETELQEFGPLGGIKQSGSAGEDMVASGSFPHSLPSSNEIPTVARRMRLARAKELLAAAAAAGGGEAKRQLAASNEPGFDMASALALCGLVDKWDIHGNPYDLKEVPVRSHLSRHDSHPDPQIQTQTQAQHAPALPSNSSVRSRPSHDLSPSPSAPPTAAPAPAPSSSRPSLDHRYPPQASSSPSQQQQQEMQRRQQLEQDRLEQQKRFEQERQKRQQQQQQQQQQQLEQQRLQQQHLEQQRLQQQHHLQEAQAQQRARQEREQVHVSAPPGTCPLDSPYGALAPERHAPPPPPPADEGAGCCKCVVM